VPPPPPPAPPAPPSPAPPPAPTPPPPPPPPAPEPPPAAADVGDGAAINLNSVTFEQLRGQNLSVTQATRLLAHRERLGGFQSVDDLDQVAGFPQDLLVDLKQRSTV
jgi:DNA uptake protein ComE-like DNA-binding protein